MKSLIIAAALALVAQQAYAADQELIDSMATIEAAALVCSVKYDYKLSTRTMARAIVFALHEVADRSGESYAEVDEQLSVARDVKLKYWINYASITDISSVCDMLLTDTHLNGALTK